MNERARVKLAVSLGSASVLAFVFAQACGGDDNTTGDGGLDGTTGADALPDNAKPDTATDSPATDGGTCPTYTGSNAFCNAVVARCGACPAGTVNFSKCQLANFTAVCDYVAPSFSQAYANAVTACETKCDVDASNACIGASLADASLTTAQTKVATDYCARCGDGGAGCAATIEKQLNLVEVSDTLAGKLDLCTPDASAGCGNAYGACVTGVIGTALTGGPCDGG